MITEKQMELLTERLMDRVEKANTKFLKSIGYSIKEIKKMTSTQAQQLIQILKYGGNYEEIINKIAEYMDLNVEEVDAIFSNYAKKDQMFNKKFYEYKNIPFVKYSENDALKRQTMALANITKQAMRNFTRSTAIGYSINGEFYSLRETYEKLLDEALLNVSQGKETFDSAMKNTLKEIGGSGLKTLDYESGRQIRLDSMVRMHLKDGLRTLHNENQELFGEEFGADGVEISVHMNPAPDHADIQGRQFSNKKENGKPSDWERLQNGERVKDYSGVYRQLEHSKNGGYRPISEYNCYHYIFSIVLGANKPEYSDSQLQEIIDNNNKGFELDGKHYTNYEGTQMQRALERRIREQKDTQILAKASDNQELLAESQKKITQLTNKYKELSEKSGLPTKMERLRVNGYRRTKLKDNYTGNGSVDSSNIISQPPLQKYQEVITNKTYNENTFKDMLNDYDKWYNTLDKKEIEKVLNDYDEHVQKANSLNINTIGVKESNPLGEFINKKLGYDSKPELIDEKDFWIDEDGDPTRIGDSVLLGRDHWFRGLEGKDTEKYIEEFKTGKFYAGEGYDANGTFATSSHSEALTYAGGYDEKLLYMIPKENAKIVRYNQVSGLGYDINKQIDYNKYMNEEGELYINFTDKILTDIGYLSSLFGYDIIDFEPIDTRKVILNRGAIKVVK